MGRRGGKDNLNNRCKCKLKEMALPVVAKKPTGEEKDGLWAAQLRD